MSVLASRTRWRRETATRAASPLVPPPRLTVVGVVLRLLSSATVVFAPLPWVCGALRSDRPPCYLHLAPPTQRRRPVTLTCCSVCNSGRRKSGEQNSRSSSPPRLRCLNQCPTPSANLVTVGTHQVAKEGGVSILHLLFPSLPALEPTPSEHVRRHGIGILIPGPFTQTMAGAELLELRFQDRLHPDLFWWTQRD